MNLNSRTILCHLLFTTISSAFVLESFSTQAKDFSNPPRGFHCDRKHKRDSRDKVEDELIRSRIRFLRFGIDTFSPLLSLNTFESHSESEDKRVLTHVRKARSMVMNEAEVGEDNEAMGSGEVGDVQEVVEDKWFKFKHSLDFGLF